MLAQIPSPPSNIIDLGPLSVHFYGIAIAAGVLIAITLTRRRYASYGFNPDKVDAVAIVAVITGFLGARLGFVVWRLDRYFPDDPLGVIAIWRGGLVLFGGLLFGTVAAYLYARRRRVNVPAFADAAAPGIPLAQALGRFGNYFNQELYGRPTDVPWALAIDPENRLPGYETFATFHPTFLYEALANVVLAVVLLLVDRTGKLKRGSLMFLYAAGYGLIRFGVELLRIDTEFRVLGLSRNNWAFLAVAVIGAAGAIWWQRTGPEPR